MDRLSASLEILELQLASTVPVSASVSEKVQISAELFKQIQEKLFEFEKELTIPEGLSKDEYRKNLVQVLRAIISNNSPVDVSEMLKILEEIYKNFPPDVFMPIDPLNPRPPRPPR